MSLFIEWEIEEEKERQEAQNKILTQAVDAALAYESIDTPTEIGLTVVSEEEIQNINKEYRDIDKVTDVLSFPLLDYEEELPSERVAMAKMDGEIDPENGEVMLGDIVICLKRAEEQAVEYGHSLEREMAFLSVHSVLHLLGYDHEDPEEEKVMFDKQRKILESIGLTR